MSLLNTPESSHRFMDDCIENCRDCARVCLETLYDVCLPLGGKHATPEHVAMMLNCAKICETSAQFMLSGSDLHEIACRACAEVCERVADHCADLGPEMVECVDACRECAASCREMSGEGSGAVAEDPGVETRTIPIMDEVPGAEPEVNRSRLN